MTSDSTLAEVEKRPRLLDTLRVPQLTAEAVVLGACAVLVALMVLVPVITVIVSTAQADVLVGASHFTLENFRFLLTDRNIAATTNTIIVAGGGTIVAGLLGTILAFIIARTNTPLRDGLEWLAIVPFFLAPFVGAMAWAFLGSPQNGLINYLFNQLLGVGPVVNIYSHGGMIWVLGLFFTPVFYLFVVAPLRRMDSTLEEAARICGCSHLKVFTRITLPLVVPAILSAGLLTLVSGSAEFGIPLALGVPYGMNTLSTEIFTLASDLPPRFNAAAAAGSVLLVLALVLIYVQRRIILPRDYTTLTGKTGQTRVLDIGRWRFLTLGFVLAYGILAVIAPMLTLFVIGFSRTWRGVPDFQKLTTANFEYIPTSELAMRAIQHSLVLALGGATVAMMLGTILAWMIYRSRIRGRGLLDFVSTIPIGVPGIVLAMGILIAYIRTPLYGTLILVGVGYVSRFLPTAQRSVSGAIVGLSRELEESARVSGASWFTMMRRIYVPLLMPAILSGWVILFVIFLREFPISILLYRDGIEVLSVAIWRFVANETVARAAALMAFQFVLVVVSLAIFRRLVGKDSLA